MIMLLLGQVKWSFMSGSLKYLSGNISYVLWVFLTVLISCDSPDNESARPILDLSQYRFESGPEKPSIVVLDSLFVNEKSGLILRVSDEVDFSFNWPFKIYSIEGEEILAFTYPKAEDYFIPLPPGHYQLVPQLATDWETELSPKFFVQENHVRYLHLKYQ